MLAYLIIVVPAMIALVLLAKIRTTMRLSRRQFANILFAVFALWLVIEGVSDNTIVNIPAWLLFAAMIVAHVATVVCVVLRFNDLDQARYLAFFSAFPLLNFPLIIWLLLAKSQRDIDEAQHKQRETMAPRKLGTILLSVLVMPVVIAAANLLVTIAIFGLGEEILPYVIDLDPAKSHLYKAIGGTLIVALNGFFSGYIVAKINNQTKLHQILISAWSFMVACIVITHISGHDHHLGFISLMTLELTVAALSAIPCLLGGLSYRFAPWNRIQPA